MSEKTREERKAMIMDFVNNDLYTAMKLKELANFFEVKGEDRPEFESILAELVDEGKLMITKKGKYQKSNSLLLRGTFISNAKGFGFVEVEGEDSDFFISEENTNQAFHLDVVDIQADRGAKPGKRREAKVIRVVEHQIKDLVGTFEKSKGFGFVIPDNGKICEDIFIPKEECKDAMTGHKVVVHITQYPTKNKNPEGVITEIIGHINDPGTDILSVVRAYGIPESFPEEEMAYLENIPDHVLEEEKVGRLDLRDVLTVTIDGEDAKDLDDAISIRKNGDGTYELGVHIADVSHYVTEYSPLDQEALHRGTSVYLVDRVIPMLPHKLSNGICSLNQGEDRLALSCIMDIDAKGSIVGHKIAETLIHVDRRMSYTNVQKIIGDHDPQVCKEYEGFVEMFELMEELAAKLRAKRRKRGSIDFDFPESKILLDEKGHPVDVHPYERNTATRIIEDFMLAANETVAEDYFWQELPFLYRVHENPDPEKIERLGIMINNYGYSIHISQDDIHPKEVQKLLDKIADTPEEAMISRLTLRSLKRARYATDCLGHFGLAAKYYCHFTSPIRRYPDLQIHRIIKENLHGKLTEKRIHHYDEILFDVASATSLTERRADDAERDVDKMKKVEYMQDHIGEEYEGAISGMNNMGIYVELMNTVEGMVRVSSMEDDHYEYDEPHFAMVGVHTRKTYRLGQKVKIRVEAADKLLRTIDFVFVEEDLDEHE
ncbi:MAG: ribonuclease R [Lachnospiraceae bacterium]|nr:ribonuclease R [Lachnospiraceae bacterium]